MPVTNLLFFTISATKENSAKLLLTLAIITLLYGKNATASERDIASPITQLSFEQAITQAQKLDPWLKGNQHQQHALESQSIAAKTLPDPQVSIGFANIATDSFDFGQEPMSQVKFAVSQSFPRGDSLALRNKQLKAQSAQYPYLRQNRRAQVQVTVGSLWLDVYQMQKSIELIEQNSGLFEQLIEISTARYASTIGKSGQQDIVRAELELTRIEDRLVALSQQKNGYLGQLNQWLMPSSMGYASDFLNGNLLTGELPQITLHQAVLFNAKVATPTAQLLPYIIKHPSVQALEGKINASRFNKRIAEQQYQPAWGVNASYAYRADDAQHNSRSDLFSVGINFDLPLFGANKQDQQLNAAVAQTEAIKTEKALRIRQLLGEVNSAKGKLAQLAKRKALYQQKLMPQIHQQADIALNAYNNDTGDFGDVVRARIDQLNAEIDYLALLVAEQKLHLTLNYLFKQADHSQAKLGHLDIDANKHNTAKEY